MRTTPSPQNSRKPAGAPAIYVSGFVASAIVAGQPDFGVLTQTEMFEHIRRICRVTTVPVFADADTGYGGVLDAQRTIRLWEEAGASVLHLEDQAMPKKCGHFAGKQLISRRRNATEASRDARRAARPRLLHRGAHRRDGCRRISTTRSAGSNHTRQSAPMGSTSMHLATWTQLKEIARRLKPLGLPLLFNMVRSGKSPYLSLKEVYELGFDYAICPVEPMLAMHKAVKEMMETFMREGCSTNAIADRLRRSMSSTTSSA